MVRVMVMAMALFLVLGPGCAKPNPDQVARQKFEDKLKHDTDVFRANLVTKARFNEKTGSRSVETFKDGPSFDIEKTTSVVSPYTAKAKFIIQHPSSFRSTSDLDDRFKAAEQRSKLERLGADSERKEDPIGHANAMWEWHITGHYAFQDGQWVFKGADITESDGHPRTDNDWPEWAAGLFEEEK